MSKKYFVAIDLGGTNLKMALIDARFKIILKKVYSTKDHRTKSLLIKRIGEAVADICHEKKIGKRDIFGIGVGAPGLVDSQKGIIHKLTNIKGWKKVNIKKMLESLTGVATYVDNDVNLMTLAELKFGAGRGARNAVCLTLGTGVGGGIIIDRKLYRGSSLAAGEIGHTILNEKGPLCGCGARGCLEAYIGNKRIIEMAKREAKKAERSIIRELAGGDIDNITPEIIDRACARGDRTALGIWRAVGEHLGTALADVVNILNPDKIIIGGGIAKAGKYLFDPARETVRKKAMDVSAGAVRIVRATLGENAGVIGAAAYVAERSGLKI